MEYAAAVREAGGARGLFPRHAADQGILYRYIPSDASRDLAFQSGEIDLIYGRYDQAWLNRSAQLPNAKVDMLGPAEIANIHLNMTQKPLDDIRVRQAIAYAIDRAGTRQLARGDVAREPAESVVPAAISASPPRTALLPYDPAEAKKLLAEAGYPNGITIKPIQTTLPAMLSTMQVVQAQLRAAGITSTCSWSITPTFHRRSARTCRRSCITPPRAFPGRGHVPDAVLRLGAASSASRPR